MATLGLGNQADVADLLAKAKNLQGRILFVLLAFIIYRFGTHLPIPGVDVAALASYQTNLQSGIFGLFNMFSGGAFSRMAIFALNIMPYITASIIVQLMAASYPALNELRKEGEVGRRKLNQYTRYLTVVLALVQGFGLATGIMGQTAMVGGEIVPVVTNPGLAFQIQTALTICAGSMFLMWLGEQINVRGIGNGISLLIFAGIVAEFPKMIARIFELARTGSVSELFVLAILVGAILAIFAIVFMETAVRKVAIQYPKRAGAMGMPNADANHLPLKLNLAGVIPPIFASALLMVPVTMASYSPEAPWARFVGQYLTPGQMPYLVIFVSMIVFFCFFYVATVAFNPTETADNLKKQGAFIPGIRPGDSTARYLDNLATRLTVIGAFYLSVVCAIPDLLHRDATLPFYIGGTSLLILVSVTIDTVARIQSALIAQKYESLLKRAGAKGGKAGSLGLIRK